MQDWTGQTLWSMLSARVKEDKDAVFLVGAHGLMTRGELMSQASRLAAGLATLGVRPGDRVAVHAANRVEQIELLFALNAIGGIYCPLHPDLRGGSLKHVVELLGPTTVFVDQERSSRWNADLIGGRVQRVLLDGALPGQLSHLGYSDLLTDEGLGENAWTGDAEAPALILMTSGTTGRSKGVLMSSQFALSVGHINVRSRGITPSDRLHTAYSFCHTNPHCFTLFPALVAGASMAWSEKFSASRFWTQIRDLGATQFSLFTAPMLILLGREETPDDTSHGASVCFSIGTARGRGREFEERFGIRIVEGYGMTECGAMTFQTADSRRLESVGKPVEEWEVRVVNEALEQLGPGMIGEIVGRPQRPGMLMSGYFRDASATLATYKDLWFHTNDSGYFDADGYLWYVGRANDVIRYRGENISAGDVEETVRATKLVSDVAAVALASDLGEDDLLLVVVESGQQTDNAGVLYDRLAQELPSFCLPRYIRFVHELPRTMTGRVMKEVLRRQGVTGDTWARSTLRTSA